MKKKIHSVIPLFRKFIEHSFSGRRLKPNGSRIQPQTVTNYTHVLRYLEEFEAWRGVTLRIKTGIGQNQREYKSELAYWRRFYRQFNQFLYGRKGFYDNYAGSVIKVLRIFFNYINWELAISTVPFHKTFYVWHEDIPIITLLPEQLNFLISDQTFADSLTPVMRETKDIFVFGCTVALRGSDLFSMCFTDFETAGGNTYLSMVTKKTGVQVRIKLPEYAVAIIQKFKGTARQRKTVFPPVSLTRFNRKVKKLAELAGWTTELGKERARKGIRTRHRDKQTRFCDQVSSHTMRRTAITTMLMLGMKEHVVRKISGHADNSQSFYRYVNLAQSYLDKEMEMAFGKLVRVG